MERAPADKSVLEKAQRHTAPIRMAFRVEGAFVNCYLAKTGSMVDAELLACMRKDFLDANPEVWTVWTETMHVVLRKIVALAFPGAELEPTINPASDHEIAGRA